MTGRRLIGEFWPGTGLLRSPNWPAAPSLEGVLAADFQELWYFSGGGEKVLVIFATPASLGVVLFG